MIFTHHPVRASQAMRAARVLPAFLSVFFTFLATTGSLFAQQVALIKTDSLVQIALKDSALLRLAGLPLLVPANAHELATPRYDYFWLYGNGNFTLGGADSTISHRYQPRATPYAVKTYPTGLYGGGGKPPPKIVRGEFTVTSAAYPNPAPHGVTKAVKANESIRLQKNHLSLVPSDTTMWVLSYKNMYKEGVPMTGNLYLFFNSPVERVQINRRTGDTTVVASQMSGVPQFGNFRNDTTLFYFPNTLNKTLQLNTGAFPPGFRIRESYKNALLWRFDQLPYGAEQHLFIQFTNDSLLLKKFPDKEQGRVQFLAVLTSDLPGGLTDAESAFAERTGLTQLFSADGLGIINQLVAGQLNSTGQSPNNPTFQPFGNITDLQTVTASLSKAHDPNQMRVDACACPSDANAAQKLLCTVDFVNDGHKATSNIYVTVHFPEGVDLNSISDEPIRIHPALQEAASNSAVELERNATERTITWKFVNFAIHPIWDYGEGHPMTYGQIVFSALTTAGTRMEDIGEIVACIRFDDPNGAAVCTVPVKPTALLADGSAESIAAQSLLQCDECKGGGTPGPVLGMPLWLVLLLALIILLSLWIVYTESQ